MTQAGESAPLAVGGPSTQTPPTGGSGTWSGFKRWALAVLAAVSLLLAGIKNLNALIDVRVWFVSSRLGQHVLYPPGWLLITAFLSGTSIFVFLVFRHRGAKPLSLSRTLGLLVASLACFGYAWKGDPGGGPDFSRNVLVVYDSRAYDAASSVQERTRQVFNSTRDRLRSERDISLSFLDVAG